MYDDLNENKSKKLALPIGMIKIPKILYIIVIILSALILVVGGLNIYLQKQKITKLSKNSSLAPLSDLQIAEKTLVWINSFKNKEGVYSVGCQCLDETCQECNKEIYIPRIIPFVLWGQFKYSEKKNNYKDLINEISLFQPNLDNQLQYGDWNCKLLYDVWKSSELSQITKDQIKNICIKSQYEFDDNLKLESGIESRLLLNINKLQKKQSIEVDKEQNINGEDLYKNAAFVSEMVTRTLWKDLPRVTFNNISESDLAKIYFEKSLFSYSAKIKTTIKDNAMLGIAAVDMYRLTNESSYLDLAKYLFNVNPRVEETNSYNLVFYGLLGQELQSITKDNQYNIDVQLVANQIIKNKFSSKNTKIEAFTGPGNFYFVVENSLIVGLLSIL